MAKKVLFYVFLIGSLSVVYAQDGGGSSFNYENELSQRASVPQSPEAAAFARYGDVAVNMYAGLPNIQVPIYTHKGRELDVPIGLSYDASGVKVNQMATPVGLGWNLNVGGRISRQVNGLPDDFHPELSNGPYKSWYDAEVRTEMEKYLNPSHYFRPNSNGSHVYATENDARDYLEFLEKVHTQAYETQPDIYTINAMGLNETFTIDYVSKTPVPLHNPNIKIEITGGGTAIASGGGIVSFKVTSDNGTEYYFDAVEQTENLKDNDSGSNFFYGTRVRFTSSWYLTKVVSPLSKDTYEFEYATYTDHRDDPVSNIATEATTLIHPEHSNTTLQNANTSVKFFNRKVISKIRHNDKVFATFTSNSGHLGGPDLAITGISIHPDGNMTSGLGLSKRYDLTYSYFKTSSGVAINLANKLQLRLKLDEVIIKDASSQEVSDYTFEYIDPFELPSLTSTGQDYLGFYNGINTNNGLIPSTSTNEDHYPFSYGMSFPGSSSGANRSANFNFAKKGLLEKITYPTGGHTTFEYEGAEHLIYESSSETTLITKATLSNQNLTLPAVDLDLCNRVSYPLGGAPEEISPNVQSYSFEIGGTDEGPHTITYTKSFTNSDPIGLSVEPSQAVLIRKEDPTITYTWDTIFNGDCEVIDPSQIVWTYDDQQPATAATSTIFLEEGHFQILLPFFRTNTSKTVTIEGPETTHTSIAVPKERAGIRINTIKDYKDASTITRQKEYSYNQTRQITNPTFEYITNERHHSVNAAGVENQVDYQQLHRLAQPMFGGTEHIVYPSVTERIVDPANPTETLYKNYRFNTPSAGNSIYYKGSYNTTLSSGVYSASHYSKLPAFGSVTKESTATTSSENTYDEYPRLHYQNFGMAVAATGTNSNLYPTIVTNTVPGQGGYRIQFSTPKYTPTVGGAPPQAGPPDACNGEENCRPEIARLMLHKTYIYGYHGSEVVQSSSTKDAVTITSYYTYSQGHRRYLKTMTTQGTGSAPQKTEYYYPYEIIDYPEHDNDGEIDCTDITLPDGTVIQLCEDGLPNTGGSYVYEPLITANMLNQPVGVQQYDGTDDRPVSTVFTAYNNDKQPETISTAKGNGPFETRMTFEQYEAGNLVQARQIDGTPVTFIWGYNERYVIAKISNMEYDNLPASLVTTIKNNADTGTEAALLTSLETLQSDSVLVDSQMSYYTYKPNIGVSTVTDPTGYRMHYFYDPSQRLQHVEDHDGNILSENEYNYKN